MNSPMTSPDRGSTLVLIDDNSGGGDRPQRATTNFHHRQNNNNGNLNATTSSGVAHPPDPLLYGLQTMEWRPWLRPSGGSLHDMDVKISNPQDEYNNAYEKNSFRIDEKHDEFWLDMHGVQWCRRTPNRCCKFLWTILISLAAAALAYELYKTAEQYIWNFHNTVGSYHIEDLFNGDSSSFKLKFPDIYLCPTNPINETHRRTRRTDIKWYKLLSAAAHNKGGGILNKRTVDWDLDEKSASAPTINNIFNNNASESDFQNFQNSNNNEENFFNFPIDPQPLPENFDSMREYFMRNGYDADAFITECAFRASPFKCSDLVETTLDRHHGKCFLLPFSSGPFFRGESLKNLNFSTNFIIRRGGTGFSAAMNIHTELYPKRNGSLFDGVYLYIDDKIDPSTSSVRKPILLSPGAYTTVALESRRVRIFSSPTGGRNFENYCHNNAMDESEWTSRNFWYVLNSKLKYSQDLCRFDCLLKSIIDSCNCLLLIDARFVNRTKLISAPLRSNITANESVFSTPTPVGYCTSEQLNECAYDLLRKNEDYFDGDDEENSCWKRCRPACERREYAVVSTSFLKMPAESYLGAGPNYPYAWNELKNNYVLVDIVLDRAQTVVVDQRPAFNLETLTAQVGGLMCLFLGCSLLTLAQIFVLCASCVKKQCQRLYGGKCLTVRKTLRKMRHSSLLK